MGDRVLMFTRVAVIGLTGPRAGSNQAVMDAIHFEDNLWPPGGYLALKRRAVDAARREGREEGKLEVQGQVVPGATCPPACSAGRTWNQHCGSLLNSTVLGVD